MALSEMSGEPAGANYPEDLAGMNRRAGCGGSEDVLGIQLGGSSRGNGTLSNGGHSCQRPNLRLSAWEAWHVEGISGAGSVCLFDAIVVHDCGNSLTPRNGSLNACAYAYV